MKYDTQEWQEFQDCVELATHTTRLKFINDAPMSIRTFAQIVSPHDEILAVYTDEASSLENSLWISRHNFYFYTGSETLIFPFEKIKVTLPFADLVDAKNDSKLRGVFLSSDDDKRVFVPVDGITDGDLDSLKIKPLVTLAREALGLVKEVNHG